MTLQLGANRDDVRERANEQVMLDANFYRTVPDECALSSSGGGSAQATRFGAILDPGETSGDTAALNGVGYIGSFSAYSPPVFTIGVWYSIYPGSRTSTNTANIGVLDNDGKIIAGVDLAGEQFVSYGGSETSALSFPPNAEDTYYVEVTVDKPNDQVDLYIQNNGGKDYGLSDSATLGGLGRDLFLNGSEIWFGYTESNGADEADLAIQRVRMAHNRTGRGEL